MLDYEEIEYAETYEKAREIVKEASETMTIDSEPDLKVVCSSVVLSIVDDMSLLSRMTLEELTGVDVISNEDLYGYLVKTMNLDRDKIMKFSLSLITSKGNMSIVEDIIKGL